VQRAPNVRADLNTVSAILAAASFSLPLTAGFVGFSPGLVPVEDVKTGDSGYARGARQHAKA
jgi:hypothetical protein